MPAFVLNPCRNADALKASIEKGALKVVVPKPASAQVKKAEVKAA